MVKRLLQLVKDELHLRRDPADFFRKQGVRIGEGTTFYGATRSMFSTEPYLIKIGKNCHITADVAFIPHDGSALILRHKHPTLDLVAPIVVGDRVFIGSRATILAGVKIGDDCIIGAGSVVTRDIPSGTVAAGVPCRPLKSVDEFEKAALLRSVGTKNLSESDKKAALLERYKDVLAD